MLTNKNENVYLHAHNHHLHLLKRIIIYVWRFVLSQPIPSLMKVHSHVLPPVPLIILLIPGIELVLGIVPYYSLIPKQFLQLAWAPAQMAHLLTNSHLLVFLVVLLPITLTLPLKPVYSFVPMDILLMIQQVHVLLLFYALPLSPMLTHWFTTVWLIVLLINIPTFPLVLPLEDNAYTTALVATSQIQTPYHVKHHVPVDFSHKPQTTPVLRVVLMINSWILSIINVWVNVLLPTLCSVIHLIILVWLNAIPLNSPMLTHWQGYVKELAQEPNLLMILLKHVWDPLVAHPINTRTHIIRNVLMCATTIHTDIKDNAWPSAQQHPMMFMPTTRQEHALLPHHVPITLMLTLY